MGYDNALYQMAQGVPFDPVGEYYRGRQSRFADMQNQNALAVMQRADAARPLIGNALAGDASALQQLGGVDPQAFMDVSNYQAGQAKAQREVSDAEKKQIAGALYAADTPEKWARTVQWLKANGHEVDPNEEDFANRDAILGLSVGPQGMQDQFNGQTQRMNAMKPPAGSGFTLTPGQTRFDAQGNQIAATPPAAPKIQPRALTAVDKNAILAADDQVQTGKNVVDMLTKALSLNNKAGSGMMAGTQAFVARNAPDFIIDHDVTGWTNRARGAATTDFSNIIMNQALSSMKSLFGGNPTEGERAVLLDLQASVDKTPTERKAILERGIELANRRIAFNTERAQQLRSGDYFGGASTVEPSGDGGDQQGAITEQDLPQVAQDAQDAIQQGADKEAVYQELVNGGVSPDYARAVVNGQ